MITRRIVDRDVRGRLPGQVNSLVGLIGTLLVGQLWRLRAACIDTDPESFFPGKGDSVRMQRRICAGCEVQDACLRYALDNNIKHGVWGGKSARERERILQAGRAAA